MFLKSKDGIRCDLCGTPYKNNFTYYSCHGTGLKIANRMVSKTGRNLTFDMCTLCYASTRDLILSHIKDAKTGHIKDDFSDNFYTNAEYMSIILTEVVVSSKAKGGIENQRQDIDIVLAADSLKNLIKKITGIKEKFSKEEDEWGAST